MHRFRTLRNRSLSALPLLADDCRHSPPPLKMDADSSTGSVSGAEDELELIADSEADGDDGGTKSDDENTTSRVTEVRKGRMGNHAMSWYC